MRTFRVPDRDHSERQLSDIDLVGFETRQSNTLAFSLSLPIRAADIRAGDTEASISKSA